MNSLRSSQESVESSQDDAWWPTGPTRAEPPATARYPLMPETPWNPYMGQDLSIDEALKFMDPSGLHIQHHGHHQSAYQDAVSRFQRRSTGLETYTDTGSDTLQSRVFDRMALRNTSARAGKDTFQPDQDTSLHSFSKEIQCPNCKFCFSSEHSRCSPESSPRSHGGRGEYTRPVALPGFQMPTYAPIARQYEPKSSYDISKDILATKPRNGTSWAGIEPYDAVTPSHARAKPIVAAESIRALHGVPASSMATSSRLESSSSPPHVKSGSAEMTATDDGSANINRKRRLSRTEAPHGRAKEPSYETVYTCRLKDCGSKFSGKKELLRHQQFHKSHIEDSKKLFCCTDERCKKFGTSYTRPDNLKRHEKKHASLPTD